MQATSYQRMSIAPNGRAKYSTVDYRIQGATRHDPRPFNHHVLLEIMESSRDTLARFRRNPLLSAARGNISSGMRLSGGHTD